MIFPSNMFNLGYYHQQKSVIFVGRTFGWIDGHTNKHKIEYVERG